MNENTAKDFSNTEKKELVEALIFASEDPVTLERMSEVSGLKLEELALIVSELEAREDTPFDIVKVAKGYKMRTKFKFASFIRLLRQDRPRRLSAPALETLAIIAYRQPVVKSDVEKIRGVDCTPTLKTLIDRELVTIVGHQQSVGTPALFGTTEEFLKVFGLDSLSDLPTLKDLAMFDRDPGERTANEEPIDDAQDKTAEVSL